MEGFRLLKSYIQGIRSLTGAGCASLYVPAPKTRSGRVVLIHDGELDPVPELANEEAARGFEASVQPEDLQLGRDGHPVYLASSADDAGLIPMPADEMSWCLPKPVSERAGRRRRDEDPTQEPAAPGAWLGLRFPPGLGTVLERLSQTDLSSELYLDEDPGHWWSWLFALGGALASHTTQASVFLKDPITGLADRREFQAVLSYELETAQIEARPLSLLLINPDEFFAVNEHFGRETGDCCVREISERLRHTLRAEDLVARYGGVIFAAILPDTPLGEAQEIAERLLKQLANEPYLDGAVQLGFSIGYSAWHADGDGPKHALELLQQSDRALSAAKRYRGNAAMAWGEQTEVAEAGSLDRLSGIFTGNTDKDYRNMVLLWDTVNVIALDPDFDQLVDQVVVKLYEAFKPKRVGLYSRSIDDDLNLLRGLTRQGTQSNSSARIDTLELDPQRTELMERAVTEGTAQECRLTDADAPHRCYAVPLVAGSDCLGCLYLDGREDALSLDASDLVFFRALGSQVATAMDRARWAEIEVRRQEHEKRMLRAELKELRQALQQAKLVFRSPQMEALVATANRVATTDATVLITGPSGTGKELLARTVHELSPRRGQPFVIVDCGSIPSTLIESELFGSEKGAYTGAQTRRAGRLAEANYGTVLLDEIGELPLEVQSKLLRFVQEKQFTRVGGNRQQKVDVRILAATNRDLKAEVAAGRFREDLYYRLNVVHLAVPPLRERPDDILHLAGHFLELFSVQYQKNVRGLTSAATTALQRHPWPGNVRELQNRLMQAVILCEGTQLTPSDLGLASGGLEAMTGKHSSMTETVRAQAPESAPPQPVVSSPQDAVPSSSESPLRRAPSTRTPPHSIDAVLSDLRQGLADLVGQAANGLSPTLLPLGRWLNEDLLLSAEAAAEGVARRAAEVVGLPESTFRRRLQKAKDRVLAGLSPRVAGWEDVKPVLDDLIRVDKSETLDLIAEAQRVLLEEILERFPSDVRAGSALLAVTPPTFRRRVAALTPVQTPVAEPLSETAPTDW